MELNAYEEAMRELFTIKAYKVFTIDKLVQSTCRQVRLARVFPRVHTQTHYLTLHTH